MDNLQPHLKAAVPIVREKVRQFIGFVQEKGLNILIEGRLDSCNPRAVGMFVIGFKSENDMSTLDRYIPEKLHLRVSGFGLGDELSVKYEDLTFRSDLMTMKEYDISSFTSYRAMSLLCRYYRRYPTTAADHSCEIPYSELTKTSAKSKTFVKRLQPPTVIHVKPPRRDTTAE